MKKILVLAFEKLELMHQLLLIFCQILDLSMESLIFKLDTALFAL